MSHVINSIGARLREYIGDRRQAQRRVAHRRARLLFSVSSYLRPLDGYTRDLSAVGLKLIVFTNHIGAHYLTGEGRRLQVALELPTGSVKIDATPVRYEQLETSYLIGARIISMADGDRARFSEYLNLLN